MQSNIEVHLCCYLCLGKSVDITYSECVFVGLVIKHAVCMHHIVVCAVVRYFFASHKQQNFENKNLLNIKCVL
jgi:hypothetical protein